MSEQQLKEELQQLYELKAVLPLSLLDILHSRKLVRVA
jgi:hypothetical protein